MRVLLGTTNPSKVKRFSDLLKGYDIEFITLRDIEVIEEPKEMGNTPEENAIMKAELYGQYFDVVICNDSGLYFEELDFEDLRQPGLNIRTPMNMDRLSDEEMIDYYSKLIAGLGGKVTAYYLDGITVYNHGVISSFMDNMAAQKNGLFYMIDKASSKRFEGWPLDSLSINKENGKYFVDGSIEESKENIIKDQYQKTFIFPWDNGAWCANMTTLWAPFGCTDYNEDHRAIKDGKVYYQAASEEYKNALAYFHGWFEEGLIDIEVFSQDSSQYIAKGNGEDARLGTFVWWEIPEVVGYDRAEDYAYLPVLDGPDGTHHVNLNETSTVSRDQFAVTSACKDPKTLLNWVDQMYDPMISMQCNYGPIGVFFDETPDEKGVYKTIELKEGETEGELKSKTELLGPTRQLTEDYGKYFYLEARAQQRLDDLRDFWFNYVDSTESYPNVVYTEEEIDVINDRLSDLKSFTEERASHWLRDGGIEAEWDQYLKDLDSMGLQDVVGAWQSAYDRYAEAVK